MTSEQPDTAHDPCCSSHGVPMTCERYRRTHFVEVRPCCTTDRIRMEAEATALLGSNGDQLED